MALGWPDCSALYHLVLRVLVGDQQNADYEWPNGFCAAARWAMRAGETCSLARQ